MPRISVEINATPGQYNALSRSTFIISPFGFQFLERILRPPQLRCCSFLTSVEKVTLAGAGVDDLNILGTITHESLGVSARCCKTTMPPSASSAHDFVAASA
jgi:hypothetical protein